MRGFQTLVTVVLATIAKTATGMSLDVEFQRFVGNSCDSGLQIGKTDILHNNHCRNWGHRRGFESFMYHRQEPHRKHNNYAWMYDLPDCNIAVYSELDCQGERYIMGPFPNTVDTCGFGFGFEGRSVGVACDQTHPYAGIGCTKWCEGMKFDFQTQVDATGFKHNDTELPCCHQKKACSWTHLAPTYIGASCKKPNPKKLDPKTAGGRDRLHSIKWNEENRKKAQEKLAKSAEESRKKQAEVAKQEKDNEAKFKQMEKPDKNGCIGCAPEGEAAALEE